jgi:hypothetical protein
MPKSISEIQEPLRALLAKAESTPAAAWRIENQDHALMVEAAETSGVSLPVTAFRSATGAVAFLRTVLGDGQRSTSSWFSRLPWARRH